MPQRERGQQRKPITTPSATTSNDATSPRVGRFCFSAASSNSPSAPAIVARERQEQRVEPCTATRVAGSEPLNMITPSSPLSHPSVVLHGTS